MGLCRSRGSRATSCQSWRSEKKNSADQPGSNLRHLPQADRQNFFFKPPTLIVGSSAALQPTETHSTSLERSKPFLLTQALFKSLAALLTYFISVQSDLISIGLM